MSNPDAPASSARETVSKGKVTADTLNVRSGAGKKFKIVGSLSRNALVEISDRKGDWYEIRFKSGWAFVHSGYVETTRVSKRIKGKVTASTLNVRQGPGKEESVIGSLSKNEVLEIVDEHPPWLAIEFNNSVAYVHRDYVERVSVAYVGRAQVTAKVLNVRRMAGRNGQIVGKLKKDTIIEILAEHGQWCEVMFNGAPAFVHRKYVEVLPDGVVDGDLQPTRPTVDLYADTEDDHSAGADPQPLEPEIKLDVTDHPLVGQLARTWNSYGGLIQSLSRRYRMETGCALAVLCVESSGKGFEQNNHDKMVIRFENHKFWSFWGKSNADEFHKRFKYGKQEGDKRVVWKGHEWFSDMEERWLRFHGSQNLEWQVLECARALDDTAALRSISMGAPQIMGYHHSRLGYSTVQEMFKEFQRDIRYHLEGLFRFLDERMLRALQRRDFVTFAGLYNGSGQKKVYGARIEERFQAFEQLMA